MEIKIQQYFSVADFCWIKPYCCITELCKNLNTHILPTLPYPIPLFVYFPWKHRWVSHCYHNLPPHIPSFPFGLLLILSPPTSFALFTIILYSCNVIVTMYNICCNILCIQTKLYEMAKNTERIKGERILRVRVFLP